MTKWERGNISVTLHQNRCNQWKASLGTETVACSSTSSSSSNKQWLLQADTEAPSAATYNWPRYGNTERWAGRGAATTNKSSGHPHKNIDDHEVNSTATLVELPILHFVVILLTHFLYRKRNNWIQFIEVNIFWN